MTSSLSHLPGRDVERLSAYLDGQLSSREQDKLRARLAGEPHLRRALAELESTVGLLQAVPQVRPPRSFSLTPEMVASPSFSWTVPALRWATAVAAFAFFSLVGFDIVTSQSAIPASAPEAALEMPAAEPFSLQSEGQRAEADGGAAQAPEEEAAMEAAPAAEDQRSTPAPTGELGDMAGASALDEADVAQATEQAASPMAPSGGTEATEGLAGADDVGRQPAVGPRLWLRLAEVALAMLVVALAFVGWQVRHRVP